MANYGRVARRQAGEAFDVANTAWESSDKGGANLAATIGLESVPTSSSAAWKTSGSAGAKLAETVAPKGVPAMMTRTSQTQLLRSFGFCLGEQRR